MGVKRTFVPALLFPWVYIPARDAALGKGSGGLSLFFNRGGKHIFTSVFGLWRQL